MRVKRPPPPVYVARDRRDAVRLLRAAAMLLREEGDPFPVLAAARQTGIRTGTPAWTLAAQARDAAGGERDERQLDAAAALLSMGWSPESEGPRGLSRVPRCRLRVPGGRCGRPVGHDRGCAPTPAAEDQVRAVGTDHVLIGGAPTAATAIVAWEGGAAGVLRVRRDERARGLWVDLPTNKKQRAPAPVLLAWPEVRRLAADLGLELAEASAGGSTTSRASRAGSRARIERSTP